MNGNIEAEKTLRGRLAYLPDIDKSLTKSGMCADAKATGDGLKSLHRRIDNIDPHFASNVSYDNKESGLEATQLQAAINEIAALYARATELASYLPVSGGRIDGNAYESFSVNNTVGNAAYIGFYGKGEASGLIGFKEKDKPMFSTSDGTKLHAFLHEGNKPFGTYDGNGNTALRTIDTGGVGKMLLVYSTNGVGIVVPRGAIRISGSSVTWLTSSGQYYGDGILRMATNDDVFNASGVTYSYQVI